MQISYAVIVELLNFPHYNCRLGIGNTGGLWDTQQVCWRREWKNWRWWVYYRLWPLSLCYVWLGLLKRNMSLKTHQSPSFKWTFLIKISPMSVIDVNMQWCFCKLSTFSSSKVFKDYRYFLLSLFSIQSWVYRYSVVLKHQANSWCFFLWKLLIKTWPYHDFYCL